MAALQPHAVPLTGQRLDTLLAAAAAGGDDCPAGAGVLLAVKNADTAAHTVTLVTPGTVDGLPIGDRAVPVPAGATIVVPVTDQYRDAATGRASLTYDAVTGVTVAVLRTGTR